MSVQSISIDFWDTLILRTIDARRLRLLVCSELVREFSLNLSAEGLFKLQSDMGRGLTTLAHDLGYDHEYILENSWFLIGAILLFDQEYSSIFATRAIQIELNLTKRYTKKNRLLVNLLKYFENKVTITLISDFEGNEIFLAEILAHHGIDQKFKILVSSSTLYKKNTSNLFKIYLDQLGQNVQKTHLHFGDNLISDFFQPRKLNIKSYWLPRLKLSNPKLKRLIRKILSVRLRSFSYRSDKKIVSSILSNFIIELKRKAELSNRVYYIGSEGAFLSQLVWDKIANEQACLNFGRRHILEMLAGTRIQYVLSRLILENCSSTEVADFFKLYDRGFSNQFFQSLIFTPQTLNLEGIQLSLKENSDHVINLMQKLNFEDDDLFVDVGYKGTFIKALTIHSNKDFNYLQIFGNKADCSDFSPKWRSIYQSNEQGLFSYFRINTKMVEIIFADGPRAPKKNSLIENFISSLTLIDAEPAHCLSIHRFFNSPSKKLARGLETIEHQDDLKKTFSR